MLCIRQDFPAIHDLVDTESPFGNVVEEVGGVYRLGGIFGLLHFVLQVGELGFHAIFVSCLFKLAAEPAGRCQGIDGFV